MMIQEFRRSDLRAVRRFLVEQRELERSERSMLGRCAEGTPLGGRVDRVRRGAGDAVAAQMRPAAAMAR